MPEFEVTGPDGKSYDVTAPEGATQEQAFEFFKQNHKPDAAAAPAAPATSEPDHARWDVIGHMRKAEAAATGKLSADWQTFTDPKKNVESMKAGTNPLSQVIGDLPGLVTAPAGAAVHSTIGSALSYPLELNDKLLGMKPDDYHKPYKGGFGMTEPGIKTPQEGGEELSDIITGGMVAPSKIGGAAVDLGTLLREAKPAAEAGKAEHDAASAASTVNRRASQQGLTPEQWEAQKAEAAKTGDKFTLMDTGKQLRNLGGKTFRAPGDGSQIIDDLLRTRDKEVGLQLDAEIGKIAKGSTFDALQHLYTQRTEGSRDFWKEAFAHGSAAPFETHLQNAFAEADKAVHEAQTQAQIAHNDQVLLERKAATTSDIYSAPTPAEKAAARTKVNDAEFRVEAIKAQKERTRELLRQAQEDGTANAPGATWSPRLEELRQDQDIARGLVRGLKIEKKNALAEGRPFHDRDYSIIGHDEHGDPIVGAVPTMKAWAAAKEGMDAIAMEQVHPVGHPSAGRPTKEGLANRKLRDELRTELVGLNPTYGKALDAWSGPSASIDAMNQGKTHFGTRDSIEQIMSDYGKLSASDKEFYKLGAAEDLISREKDVALAGDETKAVHNSRADEERIRMLFDKPEEADQFMGSVARKRQMFETKGKIAGGSDTAERLAEDRSPMATAGQHFLTAGERAIKGHPLTAAREMWRGGQAAFTNQAKSAEIAKILADPGAKIAVPEKRPLVGGPRRRSLDTLLRDARGQEEGGASDVLRQMGLSDQ